MPVHRGLDTATFQHTHLTCWMLRKTLPREAVESIHSSSPSAQGPLAAPSLLPQVSYRRFLSLWLRALP